MLFAQYGLHVILLGLLIVIRRATMQFDSVSAHNKNTQQIQKR